ncbi:MAG: GDSL-type esterase/lipase family protein [Tissierellia bacterium]|nr:GDSL-type esterase/lipase family protein [Tissierellia bacterium]
MKHLYCFGDSLTYGFGLRQEDTWTEGLRHEGWYVENYGVNGDVLPNIVNRLKKMNPPKENSYIFLMGGTNDLFMGYKAKDLLGPINSGLEIIMKWNCKAILGIPMVPTFCIERRSYIQEQTICREFLELKDSISKLGKERNVYIIDFQRELGNLDYFQQLFFDDVHPNRQGAREMKKALLQILDHIS